MEGGIIEKEIDTYAEAVIVGWDYPYDNNVDPIDIDGQEGPEEALFKINILLKDILHVIKVGKNEEQVKMKHCCYKETSIHIYFSKLVDRSHAEEVFYQALHSNMQMDPESATNAKTDVVAAIMQTIEEVDDEIYEVVHGPGYIVMEVDVDCLVKERYRRQSNNGEDEDEQSDKDEESDEDEEFELDSVARLKEQLQDKDCSICLDDCCENLDILTTTCQHVYHRPCIIDWVNRGTPSCPICRTDLTRMLPLGDSED